ncbi:hypothetical protein DICVIV_00073 [Dictyocaulus viviparus]|uniref:Uncharacterized protein n=1 Tax=Dictyocaulus viviparus TaxID=29172 RepID=A0A0D8YA56_DICVI|nr:hypothetical protein DICVIV_00073 [Dictyocaulus viviparus]
MVRVSQMSQRDIMLNITENGVARLIFRKDLGTFTSILETSKGETISVTGKLNEGNSAPQLSSEPYIMDILIVDGESGLSFTLCNVSVFADDQKVSIENPAIKFSTAQRLIGAKADVVIQQYMKPNMIDDHKEVFVGPMKLFLSTKDSPHESVRRESICEQENILGQSDDFLA